MSTPTTRSIPVNYNKMIEKKSENSSPEKNCFCDNTMSNKFEKLWNEGQCVKSTTSTEEKITCWDGNKQYISIKPLETTYTEFKKLI